MKPFYFTFGFSHHDPVNGSLASCYTKIEAEDEGKARKIMSDRRGLKWSFCYTEEQKPEAIDRFNCTFIPFDKIKAQVGPNL